MRQSNLVLFVSAGMDKPKKRDNVLSRRQQYLNYGALTLATILSSKGYSVKMIHGGHLNPINFTDQLLSSGFLDSRYPLMLSVPSFYALSWAQVFTEAVKCRSPKTKIILGGRWVVGSDSDWLRRKVPFVDQLVSGLAENKIERLVDSKYSENIIARQSNSAMKFNLDHQLVEDFKLFQPSVEASRGCGMGCSFCEERDIPLTPLKDPNLLAQQIQEVAIQYDDYSVRPYIQSSFFAPNLKWAERFADATALYDEKPSWRCETRVDSIKPSTIAALAEGGLKVIDLGLESASPGQITRMYKSSKPDRYLQSASELINACKKNGVWVKVNFLLYAGESEKTFSETIEWLDGHAGSIKGISVGPVVVFGSPKTAKGFISEIHEAGGALVCDGDNEASGISQIHPSVDISAQDAEDLSLYASKRYMSKQDYFDLKSFSYYPRNYTYSEFELDVEQSSNARLPFRY